MTLTLGSDPEVFAWNIDHVVPAYFALRGDVDVDLPFGKAYCDGAAIEFTVEPNKDPANIARAIHTNLEEIQRYLRNHRTSMALSLVSNADVGQYIDYLPEEFGKRASLQILGCTKDIRVYSDWTEEIVRPDPKVYPYRTIGTHIHIELGEAYAQNWNLVQFITAYLDAIIGTTAVYVLQGDQPARERNILYGKSGTIRIKEKAVDGYDGIEYRVLPSHAVLCDPHTTYVFFEAAQRTAQHVIDTYEKHGFAALIKGLGGIDFIKQTSLAIDDHDASLCFDTQHTVSRISGIDVDELQNIIVPATYLWKE